MEEPTPQELNDKIKYYTTTILRKIRKIDYENVQLIPGYERSEKEYIATRKNINNIHQIIKDLKTYEHGNGFMKFVKEGMQKISENTIEIYQSRNVFESISLITRKMSMLGLDAQDTETSAKFSITYKSIAEAKNKLNEKLEEIRLKLKDKQKESKSIDTDRKKLLNMRFDLELAYQDSQYKEDLREVEKKKYQELSTRLLKDMINFVEDNGLSSTLRDISGNYKTYLENSAELLKSIER